MWAEAPVRAEDGQKARVGRYELGAELGRGAMSVVYRATHAGRDFAIKVMSCRQGACAVEMKLQFRREAAAIARLDHPGLIEVIEVGEHEGRPYLVMELAEGESLDKRIARGILDEPTVVRLAKALADALSEVHRLGLIHRDIKPANIIISDAGRARIIDFGLVSRISDPDTIVGTLRYAAPEQLGILNRAVGAPADLYALGASLFECLTGAPPFPEESHHELLHRLATVPAPSLLERRPGASPALSAIIAKLLSKDPEDRYQSARGLSADLESLSQLDAALRAGRSVSLGAHDMSWSQTSEIPLVGREREVSHLTVAWDRARRGQGTFVTLEGEGGSGKTRLANELVERAAGSGALVLAGKCQEHETVPFGALREATNQLAANLKRMSNAERTPLVARIREAAGEWAPLVRRLSSGLARLLGQTGQMRPLEPDAEQQRYYEGLATFFRELGTAEHPLVLVVDDIQWLDEGSLRVLQRLASGGWQAHLLVVATSRNGVNYRSALRRFTRAVEPRLSDRIELEPMSAAAVESLITATLGGRSLDAATVQRLLKLTHGNPFAVGQYLRTLLDSGIVRPVDGRWFGDPTAFDAAQLPKDVIELVVARMLALSPETSEIAGVAALIGGAFHLDLLGQVVQCSASRLVRAVEELSAAGLIETNYAKVYSFVHDRVREAAMEGMSSQELRDTHQAIADAMERDGEPSAADLYALARHSAEGHVDANPARVAEINLKAGVRALDEHANEEAFELLDRASNLHQSFGVLADREMELLEGLGRACAMTGRLERAFAHLEEALALAEDKRDRFRLQYLLTLTFASQGRNDEALSSLYKSFEIVGRPLPRWRVTQLLWLVGIWILALFLRMTGLGHGRATGQARDKRRILSQLHYSGSMIALFQGDPILMVSFTVRDFYNVHFLGASAETAIASAVYGAVMGMLTFKRVMRRYTRAGVAMAEQLGDRAALAVCKAYRSMGVKWSGELGRGNQLLLAAMPELHRHVPGSWYAAMMMCEQAYSYLHAGHAVAAIDHVNESADQLERTNNLMFSYNNDTVRYAEMMVTGDIVDATALWEELERRFEPMSQTIYVRLARCIARLEVMVDQEETGPEVDAEIGAFNELLSEDYYSNAARMLAGYARLNQFLKAPEGQRSAARRRLRQATRSASLRAFVPVFQCHPLIWKAAAARVDGRLDRARRLLDKADKLAARAESTRGSYFAALERARVERAAGDAVADYYARTALEIAVSESWRIKAQRVRDEFDLSQGRASFSGTMGVAGTAMTSRLLQRSQRYAEALLQVSLASASSLDPQALAKNALDEVARLLGAERALFFVVDPDSGELELTASTGGSVESISTTVVNRVREGRAPVVITGGEDGEELGSASIMAHGLRSIMAAPLMLREKMVGVVYVDNRLAKGLFTEDDVDLLLGVSNHIAIALETARAAVVEAERSAMQRDMELVGAVQNLLMPKQSSFVSAHFSGQGYYEPAAQCGGDWWWYDQRPDGSVMLMLGDVSGHGAASAMVTSAIAGAFHTMRGLLKNASPQELLTELDRRVRGFGGGFHMTMAIVRLDPNKRELTLWSAASPTIFVHRPSGVDTVSAPGHLLGDLGLFDIGVQTVPFNPGDRLLLCTDGLLELKSDDRRILGARRLAKLFEDLGRTPIDEVAKRLGESASGILGGREQEDDITFVVVEAT